MNFDELLRQHLPEQSVADVEDSGGNRTRIKNLESILTIIRKINTSLVLTDVLELVIDEAIRIAQAERGFLMLANSAGKLEFAIGRTAAGESIDVGSFKISSSVLDDVFATGEAICIENALSDERFEMRKSIMSLELQTIICAPLHTHEDKIGVIYVDSRFIQSVEKSEILSVFEILAGQSAIAIKNARLYEDVKQAYEALKQANEHIIKSERMAMKGELAAEVSHELKNLVAVVLLNLEMMQRKAGNVSHQEIETIIEKTIAGVRKIEGFSKSLLTRQRADKRMTPANLNKVVSDFVDFVKFLPKFKRNAVTMSLASALPTVDIDVDQIQQVLLNLVNNSVEASPTASVQLITEVDEENGHVLLHVQDDGPGIEPTILEKLFREKVTTKADGHGYGLPICKQIVESHGGKISVSSRVGEGVRFTMAFPISIARNGSTQH